jgi:hypothetical protein
MAMRAMLYRGLIVVLWSVVLAGIVGFVRSRGIVKEEADDPVVE